MRKTNIIEKLKAWTFIFIGVIFLLVCGIYFRQLQGYIIGAILLLTGVLVYPYKEAEKHVGKKHDRHLS